MSELVRARVEDSLVRLRLRHIAERLDAVLAAAARKEPTYIDFLDGLLGEELAQKRQKRIAMGITIAHFPVQKTLDDFDFKFQPAVDQKLIRELATGRFIAERQNVAWPQDFTRTIATTARSPTCAAAAIPLAAFGKGL